jgi:hypothetical protein
VGQWVSEMPIEYRIDHDRRRVLAEGHGYLTAEEVFRYQREVWSRPDVAGYDELMDMSDVREVKEASSERMRTLAELSGKSDPPGGTSKFAIVAPQALMFGLGRMYQAYREMNPRSTKRVSVFRDRAGALRWLEGDEKAGQSEPSF